MFQNKGLIVGTASCLRIKDAPNACDVKTKTSTSSWPCTLTTAAREIDIVQQSFLLCFYVGGSRGKLHLFVQGRSQLVILGRMVLRHFSNLKRDEKTNKKSFLLCFYVDGSR